MVVTLLYLTELVMIKVTWESTEYLLKQFIQPATQCHLQPKVHLIDSRLRLRTQLDSVFTQMRLQYWQHKYQVSQ